MFTWSHWLRGSDAVDLLLQRDGEDVASEEGSSLAIDSLLSPPLLQQQQQKQQYNDILQAKCTSKANRALCQAIPSCVAPSFARRRNCSWAARTLFLPTLLVLAFLR